MVLVAQIHSFSSSPPQGLAVLFLFCVLNKEVQEAWKLACLGKKGQGEEATRSGQVGVIFDPAHWIAAGGGCLF